MLPLPPAPPANVVMFSGRQWEWLVAAISGLYEANETQLEMLSSIDAKLEKLVATTEELQTALDAHTQAVHNAVEAINTEIAQLQDAIAQLNTADPPTQAQIDQLNQATQDLIAATTALQADDPSPTS